MIPVKILEDRYPDIPWREPLPCQWPDASTFACRICIADKGLKRSSEHQWPDEAQALKHIQEAHNDMITS